MFWNRLKKHHIKNFVTGKVFPQEASQKLLNVRRMKTKFTIKMIKEWLQPAGIFAPVKKLQLNCFNPFLANVPILYPLKTPENLWVKRHLRKALVKLGDSNLWKKMATISKSREIDQGKLIAIRS